MFLNQNFFAEVHQELALLSKTGTQKRRNRKQETENQSGRQRKRKTGRTRNHFRNAGKCKEIAKRLLNHFSSQKFFRDSEILQLVDGVFI